MLKEIIKKPRSKVVIVVVIVTFLFIAVYCVIQPKKENNIFLSNKIESEEFSSVSGNWRITEYLGESVEYHGAEATTKAERNENDKIIRKIKKKYLNKEFLIDSKHITVFSPPTELGYHVLNWNDLFLIYRQPPNIWDGISPPFLCVSFSHSDLDDSFDLIIDTNSIATLVVKGQFFRLEKVVTDKGVD
jgi:hypothetical protein